MSEVRRIVEIPLSGSFDLKGRTIEYFEKSGFKHIPDDGNKRILRFKRGSIVSNLWTFNPLSLKSRILVEFDEGLIKCSYVINTIGVIYTKEDRDFWDLFLTNYENYILDKDFDFTKENSLALKKINYRNFNYIPWAAVGGFYGAIPTGLLAYYTGVYYLVYAGATFGALTVVMKKMNDKKKQVL